MLFHEKKELTKIIPVTLTCILILLSISKRSVSAVEMEYWPTDKWRVSTPEAQGIDSEKLMGVIPYIIDNLMGIQSLVVVRNGYIVFENYYGSGMPNKRDTVHSVTKSITSALVGIAHDKGLITDLDQSLFEIFPEHFRSARNPRKEITLKNLLTMTSGLKAVRVKDWSLLMQFVLARDKVQFTLELPLEGKPGETFAYSNAMSDMLGIIVAKSVRVSLSEFANEHLFEPLGILPPVWKKDPQGYNTGHGGLYLSTRDMCKIGLLYSKAGIWDKKQIISKTWIEESTNAHIRAGERYSYGYQWWIRPVAGCRSYRAWGRNGQFIVIVPELDMVIAVTSETRMPGYSSEHYAPLFDIIAGAVMDTSCSKPITEKFYRGLENLPADIRAFLNNYSAALEGGEVENILKYYSENYLNNGRTKQSVAEIFRLAAPVIREFNFQIDLCRQSENRAKIWGTASSNLGPLTLGTTDLKDEDGTWKWYGNQVDN